MALQCALGLELLPAQITQVALVGVVPVQMSLQVAFAA